MEITAINTQTVNSNQNVLFTDIAVPGCASILHRQGSGLVTLRGLTNQCRARFKVFFSGNIAISQGGSVGPISVAISINGEPVRSTEMITAPAEVAYFNNVASAVYIDVPTCCCVTISVKNTSTQSIDVQNANLIVERVA